MTRPATVDHRNNTPIVRDHRTRTVDSQQNNGNYTWVNGHWERNRAEPITTPGFTDLDAVLPMGGHGTVTGAGGRIVYEVGNVTRNDQDLADKVFVRSSAGGLESVIISGVSIPVDPLGRCAPE